MSRVEVLALFVVLQTSRVYNLVCVINCGISWTTFLQVFLLLCSFFWYLNYMCFTFLNYLTILGSFVLLLFFFLYLSLKNFYWPIFKKFNSLFGSVQSIDESIRGIHYFCHSIFSSSISFFIFLRVSISLLSLLICFVCCIWYS